MGRVYNSVCYDPSKMKEAGTLTWMKGKMTKVDLRHSLGLEDVEFYIKQRQMGYIGHIARLPGHRVEKLAIGLHLCGDTTATTTYQDMSRANDQ